MKKRHSLPPLARAYFDLLTSAHEERDPGCVVMLALPNYNNNADDDAELESVRLPKAIHMLCWSIAEYSEEDTIDAIVLAFQTYYNLKIHLGHLFRLLYDIHEEMVRTAEEAGVLLTIMENGRLQCRINDYTIYYEIPDWKIELPERDYFVTSLAKAIEYTAKLRCDEKREKRRSR